MICQVCGETIYGEMIDFKMLWCDDNGETVYLYFHHRRSERPHDCYDLYLLASDCMKTMQTAGGNG